MKIHVYRFFLALALSWVCLATPQIAIADNGGADRATAQALFDEGRKLMHLQQFELACPKFEESARVIPLGGTLLNLADCYEKLGLLATAWSTFLNAETVAHRANNHARELEAHTRATRLESRLPRITIHIDVTRIPSGFQVFRDEILVGSGQWETEIPIDPGTHQITANAPGYRRWELVVLASPTERLSVDIPVLEALPVPSAASPPLEESKPKNFPSSLPTPSSLFASPQTDGSRSKRNKIWVAGGVGLVGFLTGVTTGILSFRKHRAADERCTYDECHDEKGVELRNESRIYGNISTGAFIVGALGTTLSVTFWLASPRGTTSPKRRQNVAIGPGHVALQCTW
jgi:hypothetical protein